ncbi:MULTISPECIES: hypothetical protein [unclassified Moorena]|nr:MULTISPECIES: hypothetical protein [unclassified Moorena]NEO11738.1 hypothetical protein [Moorena sp. SIO3E8]NEP98247.1 hypothetical protein [Moorena sp. SIO3F7]
MRSAFAQRGQRHQPRQRRLARRALASDRKSLSCVVYNESDRKIQSSF